MNPRMRDLVRGESGQAIAEFSIVVFLLVLVLFSILEIGLLLNDKLVLTNAAREVARVCAVKGGKTQEAADRLVELVAAAGMDPDAVEASSFRESRDAQRVRAEVR